MPASCLAFEQTMRSTPDTPINPDTRQVNAADGGKLGTFSRGFHRLWGGFAEIPGANTSTSSSNAIINMAEGRSHVSASDPGPENAASDLKGRAVVPGGEGQVVDMGPIRMAREAREEIERLNAEAAEAPDLPAAEDMF